MVEKGLYHHQESVIELGCLRRYQSRKKLSHY